MQIGFGAGSRRFESGLQSRRSAGCRLATIGQVRKTPRGVGGRSPCLCCADPGRRRRICQRRPARDLDEDHRGRSEHRPGRHRPDPADRGSMCGRRKDVGALNEEIWHTPITPDGQAGTATRAATGFNSASDPDLIVMPDGSLRVFFGGLAGSNELDGCAVPRRRPAPTGGTWTPQGMRVSSTQSAVGPVVAALRPDGTPRLLLHAFVRARHPRRP